MLNVTQRHVFVSQEVCKHTSFNVRTTRMKTPRSREICVETCRSRLNIRNYVTSCIQTRPPMRKLDTETSL